MIVTKQIEEARAARRADPTLSWGLVPTMGYLHEGHLSLVQRARAENERVAVSIYVNPTQFAPDEDLDTYPRNLARDLKLLQQMDVDLAFAPEDETMYPAGFQTTVTVDEVTRKLEGVSRPTHFQGVTTVVAKLFNIMQPTHAYFGQKDAQQTVVVRRMVQDLNFDVDVVICPIVREPDGLALSSRNKYLTPAQRKGATVLYRALTVTKTALQAGEHDGDALRKRMAAMVATEPLARVEYVSVADPNTLEELERVETHALLSLAVSFGKVRLIDNMPVTGGGERDG